MTATQIVAGSLMAIAGLATQTPRSTPAIDPDAVDAEVERIRRAARIPGVAVVIVHRDSIVHMRGYGVREVEREEPVDAHTLFAVGSATKAFTATLIGMLVDDGTLRWDDRVIDRLPGFALQDPYASAEITIRDLLAHRSGLPAANLMWLTTSHPPETLIRRLRWLEPVAGFRSAFTYQNALYLVAGRVAEAVTGRTWGALLGERILDPLGMAETNASVASLAGRSNVATPHTVDDDVVVTLPWRSLDDVAPAGAINSNVSDLSRWLRFLIADGVAGGERRIESSTLAETRSPQIVIPADPVMTAFHPAARVQAYGMGWFVTDFHGRTLVAHGGGIDGMSALVAWVPEEELGVAILTNLQTPAPVWIYGILYEILDPALGVGPTDWKTPARQVAERIDAILSSGTAARRVEGTRLALALEEYVGTYESRTLGEVRVILEGGTLVFEHGTLRGVLEHWHHDTFRVTWEDVAWRAAAGQGWITFRLDRAGGVQAMELEALPGERERLETAGETLVAPPKRGAP